VADDKTAAERAAEERYSLHHRTDAGADLTRRERLAFVAGAAWMADRVTVAPDHETRDKLREVVAGDVLGGWNEHHCIENQGCTVCAGNRAVDAVLASGVLGVPADPEPLTGDAQQQGGERVPDDAMNAPSSGLAVQRTADRETIARALWYANVADLPFNEWSIRHPEQKAPIYKLADAVLAVLVPTDQIRAETPETIVERLLRAYEAEHGERVHIPADLSEDDLRVWMTDAIKADRKAAGA